MGVKRADKRRIDELRVEDGVMETFKNKLVSSGLKWAGHVERMRDETLSKRSDAQKVENQDCDGRTALREIWKVWAENEE